MEPRSWKIGVDLGSTLSSVAYCLTSGSAKGCVPQRIYSVRGSRDVRSRSDSEVCEFPTIVLYENEGRWVRWGWHAQSILNRRQDLQHPVHVVKLFKAGLHDCDESQLVREELEVLPFRKSVGDVATDFLTHLLQHTKGRLEQVGYRDGDDVHLICTVPAMWSMKAKRETMKAAEKAKENCGFTFGREVSLCYEPVAAAAYVFHQEKCVALEKDDALIICDAGGVTVDLVTYVADSVNPLRLNEVAKGTGQTCGSSYLNRRFQVHIEKLLAGEKNLRTQPGLKPLDEAIQLFVMSEFEYTKRDYPRFPLEEGNDDSRYTQYHLPGLEDNSSKGFSRGDILVTRRQIEAVYLPILEKCWGLVESQIGQAYKKHIYPTLLILVGGFAGSYRLQEYIKERCQELTAQHAPQFPIQVIIPEAP